MCGPDAVSLPAVEHKPCGFPCYRDVWLSSTGVPRKAEVLEDDLRDKVALRYQITTLESRYPMSFLALDGYHRERINSTWLSEVGRPHSGPSFPSLPALPSSGSVVPL